MSAAQRRARAVRSSSRVAQASRRRAASSVGGERADRAGLRVPSSLTMARRSFGRRGRCATHSCLSTASSRTGSAGSSTQRERIRRRLPGAGARERHAGGGRDVDAPAFEDGGGAAGEGGFGRDEGGGACPASRASRAGAGRRRGLPRFRLRLRRATRPCERFGDEVARRARGRRVRRGARFQSRVSIGGREGFVDEAAAGASRGGFSASTGQGWTSAGLRRSHCERRAERVLRMAGGVGDGGPAFGVRSGSRPGKTMRPRGSSSTASHQAARGGAGAGGAGDDDGMLRRLSAPSASPALRRRRGGGPAESE